MAVIQRIRATWTGFAGAPGYSNFHFSTTDPLAASAAAAAARVRTFFFDCRSYLVAGSTVSIDTAVPFFNEEDGLVFQEVAITAPSPVSGLAPSQGYSGATGASVKWSSATYREGHRVYGRTYLVPLAGGALQNNGSLDDTARSVLTTAAAALLTGSPSLLVYSRPRAARAARLIDGSDAVDARPGLGAAVTACAINDKVAVLRSRRD